MYTVQDITFVFIIIYFIIKSVYKAPIVLQYCLFRRITSLFL